MPCDRGRSPLIRLAPVLLMAAAAAGPVRSQPEPERPAGRQLLENSIDRWNRMSPAQRERELAKLPPGRARLIRRRIWRYNHMRPEEQQALRERYQTFAQLPPDKQEIVRARLRQLYQLPVERRTAIYREIEQLRLLPEARRPERLNADEFRGRFSPQEHEIIRDLMTYLPN